MGVETAIILGVAGAGMGAFASATQASDFNKAERQRVQAAQQVQRVQTKQVQRQAAVEQTKSMNRAHLIRSRIRVAAGESGIGLGGTYEALVRQTDIDQAFNEDIIQQNLFAKLGMIRQPLIQREVSPLMAGLSGGLGGLGSGLSIGTSIASIADTWPRTQGVENA